MIAAIEFFNMELGKGIMNFIDGSMPSFGSEHLVNLRQREEEINESANDIHPVKADESEEAHADTATSGIAKIFRRFWPGGSAS